MALSAFDDKSHQPTDADLAAVLGRSGGAWDELKSYICAEYQPLVENWQFSGAKWGWSLRLKQKKRAVVYMTPQEKRFQVGFALGEKAVKAARNAKLPDNVLAIIDSAPKYAEGRGFRMEIKTKKELAGLKKLIAIRMGI